MEFHLSEDFKKLRSSVRELVQNTLEPISLSVENNSKIPENIVDEFRRLGLFGMSIPKKYGGLGLTTLEEILIYEEITKTNACFRSRIGTSNGIGSMGIVNYGTEVQKETYLPRIASGEWTSAFALTEPNAGSDAANISTTAVYENGRWVLNGNKVFITNADAAQIFTTVAVTDEKKRAHGGVTTFIVERGTPGFSIGAADKKMGMKGSHTHELVFKDCRIPEKNVIGGAEMVGHGFRIAMRVLDKGRLTMGACALGAAQRVMELSVNRIRQKIAAGKPRDALQGSS